MIAVLTPSLLILTPVKDAEGHLDRYFESLCKLEYPKEATSLGFLESDSSDGTYDAIAARLPELRAHYARVTLVKRDFGFRLPPGRRRWQPWFQLPRRSVLAKSRNHLLFAALRDEQWVLWLDADLASYPPDVLQRLLATGRDILAPHCVTRPGGPTFDWNSWRERGNVRMDGLRDGPELVRLDAVGTTMLLVRADAHRDGLVFPPFPYGGGELARPGRQPTFMASSHTRCVIEVPLEPLEAVLRERRIHSCEVAFVWSDTQGCEAEVIASGTTLWETGVPLYAEFWPYGLEQQGGAQQFVELAEGSFRSFIEAGELVAGRPVRRPLSVLRGLLAGSWWRTREEWHTDLLVLSEPPTSP